MARTWEDFLDDTDRLLPDTWELPSDWAEAKKHMEFMLERYREGTSIEESVLLYNDAFQERSSRRRHYQITERAFQAA